MPFKQTNGPPTDLGTRQPLGHNDKKRHKVSPVTEVTPVVEPEEERPNHVSPCESNESDDLTQITFKLKVWV